MFRTIAFSAVVVVLTSTLALTSTGCRHCQNCHDAGGPVYVGGVPTVGRHGQRAGSIFSPAQSGRQAAMITDSGPGPGLGPIITQDGMFIGASASNTAPLMPGFVGPAMEGTIPLTYGQTPREGEIRVISDEVTIPAAIPQTPVPSTGHPENISTPAPRPITAATPAPTSTGAPGEWSSVPETAPLQPVVEEPVVATQPNAAPGLLR